MKFIYNSYTSLINLLKEKNYRFIGYKEETEKERVVIIRHDIDNSLEKAIEIAGIEKENNIKSTFFVLLSTNFYNVFSRESRNILKEILELGHEIGLHFDEKQYEIKDEKELEYYIEYEKDILGEVLDIDVQTVSMHRPSKWILENDIEFKNIINSYSKKYFSEFKYISDSRMNWGEDVIGIIKSEQYRKLHILTHPFWYEENIGDIKERVSKFINSANYERYSYMEDNIRSLEEIMVKDEIK